MALLSFFERRQNWPDPVVGGSRWALEMAQHWCTRKGSHRGGGHVCVMIEFVSFVRFQLMGSLWLSKEDREDMKYSPHPAWGQRLRNV